MFVFSQTKGIFGKVLDASGNPLPGVSVIVKGTKTSAITNVDGMYNIKAQNTAILVFSFIGMETKEEAVNGKSVVNIVMQEKSIGLNEAVAIGYGTVKRKDLTGSVGSVNMTEINKISVSTIDQALAGQIAGVNVFSSDAAPGAKSQIVIRGGSLSQDPTPLYIIDGFPFENFDIRSLNPKDIESIDVLKDASSIAIYGSRGANGVIIITTKRPNAGKCQISYSTYFSMVNKPSLPAMMNPYEYVKMQQEIAMKEGTSQYATFKKLYLDNGTITKTLDDYKNDAGYNWSDLLMRPALMQNHNLNITGGNAETKYNITLGYVDQQGIILNTGMKRYNGQVNIDQRVNDKLKLSARVSYSSSVTNSNSVMGNLRQYRPTSGLKGQDLLVSEIDSAMLNGGNLDSGLDVSLLINPLQQAQNEFNQQTNTSYQANGKIEWKILNNLTFTSSINYNTTNNTTERFYNSQTVQGNIFNNSGGTALNANGVNGSYSLQGVNTFLTENLLNYRKTFLNRQSLDITLGATYQYSGYKTYSSNSINMAPDFEYLTFYNWGSGTPTIYNVDGSSNRLLSGLGRLNYSIMDRYLFTTSVRADGSSKFMLGKQWGVFPSGAFAWRLSNEPFMASLKDIITDAKIRLSAGSVGNNRGVNDFAYLLELGGAAKSYKYNFDGSTFSSGLAPFFYSNPSITWEKSNEYNVGFDCTLLTNRISLSVDYYNKRIDGFLMPNPIPYYMGYQNGSNTRYENMGYLLNKGLEITMGFVPVELKKFRWALNLNATLNNNKIESLSSNNDVFVQGGPNGISPLWIARKGYNLTEFYGFKSAGLYQKDDFYTGPNGNLVLKSGVPTFATLKNSIYPVQPGDRKYQDLNGDGVIDDNDRTILGSPIPYLFGGFSSVISWGNFTLSAFFQYNVGNKVFNLNRVLFETTGKYYARGNMFATFANRWTPDNTNTDIPRIMEATLGGDAGTSAMRCVDTYIEDGSFLRFSNLVLIYQLPRGFLDKLKITNAQLNVSAQNLALWTKYSGQDPDVSSYSNYNTNQGIGYTQLSNTNNFTSMTRGLDNAAYPRSLVLSMGLNITF
ncbi:MAG: TonB-dependent receptor [Paludibacter sp.]